MNIDLINLGRLHDSIKDELFQAFSETLKNADFVGSNVILEFENELAKIHSRKFAITCGSGTDALTLSLIASGVTKGDEVILPANTFVATAEAIIHAGGKPVFVDVNDENLLISEEHVKAAITEKTRAIIPVHLFGNMVSFNLIKEWKALGLTIIEDAAQAHLGKWHDKSIGENSLSACLSFYPAKNLGALGDGGAVLTDNLDFARKIQLLRDHGRNSWHGHELVGFCSRLDSLQARFLSIKLRYLEQWTEKRREIASMYHSRLNDIEDIKSIHWESDAVYHLFVVRVDPEIRNQLRELLGLRGIQTGIHYPLTIPEQEAFSPWKTICPIAKKASREILSLPLDPLMTHEEVDYICNVLIESLNDLKV